MFGVREEIEFYEGEHILVDDCGGRTHVGR